MKALELSQTYRKEMEKVLTEDRLDHSLGVAYTAANLAAIYDVSIKDAITAGMLHDCAKCLSHEERLHICEQNAIEVTDIELQNPSLLHAKVGEFLARTKYDIKDSDILNAIRFHTTGRPAMSQLEKIIFTADFIEPNRKKLPELNAIRIEAFQNLDRAVLHILRVTLGYLDAIGKPLDPMTKNTYEYYKK